MPKPSFPSRERGLKQDLERREQFFSIVVPLAGTWIETQIINIFLTFSIVVPLAGTWIETVEVRSTKHQDLVVPLAGTWIETFNFKARLPGDFVVPLAGTWIETLITRLVSPVILSFPSRERGLKRFCDHRLLRVHGVVPLAGTWIETRHSGTIEMLAARRSPRGNVD